MKKQILWGVLNPAYSMGTQEGETKGKKGAATTIAAARITDDRVS